MTFPETHSRDRIASAFTKCDSIGRIVAKMKWHFYISLASDVVQVRAENNDFLPAEDFPRVLEGRRTSRKVAGGDEMLREIRILRTARDPKRRDPGWVKDRVGCDVTGSVWKDRYPANCRVASSTRNAFVTLFSR